MTADRGKAKYVYRAVANFCEFETAQFKNVNECRANSQCEDG